MPENLKFDQLLWVKRAPKWATSTDRGQNFIRPEDGPDTLVRQTSGHFSHGLSQKCPEPHYWPVSQGQNGAKIRKISTPWPKPNRFWRCWCYISIPNSRLFLLFIVENMPGNRSVKVASNNWKINRPWPKFWFWRWSGYYHMPNCISLLSCVSREFNETFRERLTDGKSAGQSFNCVIVGRFLTRAEVWTDMPKIFYLRRLKAGHNYFE